MKKLIPFYFVVILLISLETGIKANPCINEKKSEDAQSYKIGDFYNGGIIFWIDETGKHGLVCAKKDQSEGIIWYNGTYVETKAKESGILAGKKNTASIIAVQKKPRDEKSTYAAWICDELKITENAKNYDDWYLPGREELDLMYQNKSIIDSTATAKGGSPFDINSFYWSSTESRRGFAIAQGFGSGPQMTFNTNNTFRVRAVRAF